MAKKNKYSEHQSVLEQLIEAERRARERVDRAREEADSIIKDAKREADSLVDKAKEEAQAEADKMVEEAKKQTKEETGEIGSTSDTDVDKVETLRSRAQENMAQAVNFLVNWVTGGAE